MKSNSRFVKSVVATASKTDVQMPWARGQRRMAFVAKRSGSEPARKSA